MSRLGRSQPVQPFSAHGFVDPGPGPVGTTPARPVVVENDYRRALPLPAVSINGLYAISVAPTVMPPEPVVSVPPVRPGEWLRQPVAAHGFDEVSPPGAEVVEPEDRQRRRYWPLPSISISGVLASFVQLFVAPPAPVVAEAPRNRATAVPDAKVSHGFVDTTQAAATPPPAVNVDRADQRGRYRTPDAISISAALDSVTAAPTTPVPPAPFVVPLEERRRFLAQLPPAATHGLDDVMPQPPDVAEPDDRRRRQRPIEPIVISGILSQLGLPPPVGPPESLFVIGDDGRRRLVPAPISISGVLAPFFPPFVQPPAPLVVFVDGKRLLVPQPIVLSGAAFPPSVVGAIYTQPFAGPNPGGPRLAGAPGANTFGSQFDDNDFDEPTPTGAGFGAPRPRRNA